MNDLITIDIHGSCVSRDLFRDQSVFYVSKYIARCSIMSIQYPKIFDDYYDTFEKNTPWEKKMLSIDFTKRIFEELKSSKGDYLVIDLIDEIFDLIKVKNGDKESAVTYSQVFKRSSFIEILPKIEIIDTKKMEMTKIIDAIRNYAIELLKIYNPNQIIINEVYPAEYYYNINGNIVPFDEERRNNVKRNKYKLKLYYSLLENELYGCHIMKMNPNIVCDEQWGLATTHFEKKFYIETFQKLMEITKNNSKRSYDKLIISSSLCKKEKTDKNSFNAQKLMQAKNIVYWGAQTYFEEKELYMPANMKISYLFPDGNFNIKYQKKYLILKGIQEIEKLDNPYVLIARGKTSDVEKTANILREKNIKYDHMDMYVNKRLSICYLKAMKYYDYTDVCGNRFVIDNMVLGIDKISINRADAINAYIEIGGGCKVYSRLGIQILGNNNYCKIGEEVSFVDATIILNTNGIVRIGNECMFSHSIILAQSDQHHIFDLNSKKRINKSKAIIIGNHVWVGRAAELLGGAYIGNNCVIGAHAVTSSKFPDNVILAGCPAKIIRNDIIWARDSLTFHDCEYFDECDDQCALKYLK